MVSSLVAQPASTRPLVDASSRQASRRFEIAMVLLSAFVLCGAYLDAWAHRHVARLETFFTPWHAVLYSSVLITGLFLYVNWSRGRDAGRPWSSALPTGYGLSLLGFMFFGIGGVLDMAWHLAFGIERNYAAAISPTHLILMGSAALMVSGGLRSAWTSNASRLPYTGLVSAAMLMAVFIFFGQDLHPFTSQWSALQNEPLGYVDQFEELGVVEVILQTAVMMGIVLFLMRRFTLPPFAITILMTLTTAAVVVIWHVDPVVIVGVAGGLIADGLRGNVRPSVDNPGRLRLFAVLTPAATYLLYFLGILKTDGIWWPIHVWVGAVAIAGVTGLLVSYLVVPPSPVAPGGSRRGPEHLVPEHVVAGER